MRMQRKLVAIVAAGALVLPAAAIAETGAGTHGQGHGNNGQGHGKKKNPVVTYVFKGTYEGSAAYTPTSSVLVSHGNSFVRKQGFFGKDVSFDLTNARVVVADNNGDGVTNLSDVAVGDWVIVQARLRKADPGTQPFKARQLVDQTHPPVAGT